MDVNEVFADIKAKLLDTLQNHMATIWETELKNDVEMMETMKRIYGDRKEVAWRPTGKTPEEQILPIYMELWHKKNEALGERINSQQVPILEVCKESFLCSILLFLIFFLFKLIKFVSTYRICVCVQNLFGQIEENRSEFQQVMEERKKRGEQVEQRTNQKIAEIATLKKDSVDVIMKQMDLGA